MQRKREAVKLTLTIDKQIIEEAKNYAKNKQKSVSAIVEEYLSAITAPENLSSPGQLHQEEAPVTDSLFGMFADDYSGQKYQDLLDEALLEKYI